MNIAGPIRRKRSHMAARMMVSAWGPKVTGPNFEKKSSKIGSPNVPFYEKIMVSSWLLRIEDILSEV